MVHPHAPYLANLIPASVAGPQPASGQVVQWMPGTSQISSTASGVCLSPGSAPFPPKLVSKVLSGVYVDMKELLGDNIALLQQLESLNMVTTLPALPGVMKPKLREITSLASWLYCFLAYAALRCPDQATRDRLAYARLIVHEAQRHGGQGWREYDRVFRQQAALDHTLKWNELHPAIQASTLFNCRPGAAALVNGQSPSTGMFCSVCRGVDHTAVQCALAYQQPGPATGSSTVDGLQPPRPAKKRATVAAHSLCISWNRGKCIFPSSCTFRHICSVCFQQHPAIECPSRMGRPAPHSSAPTGPPSRA